MAAISSRVVPVADSWRLAAAARLIAGRLTGLSRTDRDSAAHRFVTNAREFGIDLTHFWVTVDDSLQNHHAARTPTVRQACLAVPGSGRTANLFLSPGVPFGASAKDPATIAAAHAERVLLVQHACGEMAKLTRESARDGRAVRLAQALLEATETDAIAALDAAGFVRLGDLAYLRRPLHPTKRINAAAPEPLPPPYEMISVATLSNPDSILRNVLERSYVKTLDCPELTGMRETSDVLESHKAVGRFDPNLWWVLVARGEGAEEPQGCVLLTPCPDQESVELVYLGLAPEARGKGLGSLLFAHGMSRLVDRSEKWITCAVDTRNAPALRLYGSQGFETVATRVPFVKRLESGTVK